MRAESSKAGPAGVSYSPLVGVRLLVAFVSVIVGAVTAFAIYTFGWHKSSPEAQGKPAARPGGLVPKRFTGMIGSERLYTIRYGDVVRYPGTKTLCQATAEGGVPQLFCIHSRRSRFQVVFNDFGVSVYDLRPPNDGFESDFSLSGELARAK
jgi:hypothetical protein